MATLTIRDGTRVTVREARQTVTARAPSVRVRVVGGSGGAGVPYAGAYEVTPTREAQVLPTSGRTLARDVTVAPIPNNYGLITYNGSVLTVS